MTRKSLILSLVVIALIAAGALTVMAQDGDDTPLPFGPGWMHQWDTEGFGPGMMHGGRGMHGGGYGRGMMGGGYGMGMMWGSDNNMMGTVAEALGLESDTFFAELQDGKSLAEIAETQGVELTVVYDAMVAEAEEHMAAAVEAGYVTQEQADEHLTWMRENVATMPMFSGAGFGPCVNGQTGFGPGMMGQGYGMRWGNS